MFVKHFKLSIFNWNSFELLPEHSIWVNQFKENQQEKCFKSLNYVRKKPCFRSRESPHSLVGLCVVHIPFLWRKNTQRRYLSGIRTTSQNKENLKTPLTEFFVLLYYSFDIISLHYYENKWSEFGNKICIIKINSKTRKNAQHTEKFAQ